MVYCSSFQSIDRSTGQDSLFREPKIKYEFLSHIITNMKHRQRELVNETGFGFLFYTPLQFKLCLLDSQDRLGVDRWARYTFCRGNTLHVAAVAACRHQWRRRWGRRGGAAVGEEVAEVVVRFCARAAMRSAETSWWQCRRGAVAAASRRFSP